MLNPIEGPPPVWIENGLLDGFLENIFRKDCRNLDCSECRYCYEMAEKVIKIDPSYREECLKLHEEIDQDLLNGQMWSYLGKNRKVSPDAVYT